MRDAHRRSFLVILARFALLSLLRLHAHHLLALRLLSPREPLLLLEAQLFPHRGSIRLGLRDGIRLALQWASRSDLLRRCCGLLALALCCGALFFLLLGRGSPGLLAADLGLATQALEDEPVQLARDPARVGSLVRLGAVGRFEMGPEPGQSSQVVL